MIHAFYVPPVPGLSGYRARARMIDWVWFTPTKIGSYQLACNQLCGSGHYNMKAQIEVVSES